MVKPRVLIADDHTLVVEAFETLLAPTCEVIGHVSDGRAMVAAVRKHQPDVVVVDVSMPLLNGLDAAYGYEFWRRLSFPDAYRLTFEASTLRAVHRVWDDTGDGRKS